VERVCFLARVRPERMDEYRERHARVWPPMLAALRAAGWGNYSVFLAADGLLVGYLETEDYAADLSPGLIAPAWTGARARPLMRR
jgi:L-rhamnose mutarotase